MALKIKPGSKRFPYRLFDALQETDRRGKGRIFKWLEGGVAIGVDRQKFEAEVLERYPGLVQISSFENLRRQLRQYNFEWKVLPDGELEFWHPNFRKNRPDLLPNIISKRRGDNARKAVKRPSNSPRSNFKRWKVAHESQRVVENEDAVAVQHLKREESESAEEAMRAPATHWTMKEVSLSELEYNSDTATKLVSSRDQPPLTQQQQQQQQLAFAAYPQSPWPVYPWMIDPSYMYQWQPQFVPQQVAVSGASTVVKPPMTPPMQQQPQLLPETQQFLPRHVMKTEDISGDETDEADEVPEDVQGQASGGGQIVVERQLPKKEPSGDEIRLVEQQGFTQQGRCEQGEAQQPSASQQPIPAGMVQAFCPQHQMYPQFPQTPVPWMPMLHSTPMPRWAAQISPTTTSTHAGPNQVSPISSSPQLFHQLTSQPAVVGVPAVGQVQCPTWGLTNTHPVAPSAPASHEEENQQNNLDPRYSDPVHPPTDDEGTQTLAENIIDDPLPILTTPNTPQVLPPLASVWSPLAPTAVRPILQDSSGDESPPSLEAEEVIIETSEDGEMITTTSQESVIGRLDTAASYSPQMPSLEKQILIDRPTVVIANESEVSPATVVITNEREMEMDAELESEAIDSDEFHSPASSPVQKRSPARVVIIPAKMSPPVLVPQQRNPPVSTQPSPLRALLSEPTSSPIVAQNPREAHTETTVDLNNNVA